MFNWIRNMFAQKSRDWEAINHEDEIKDADYMADFTGSRGETSFENANCHVRFFYGNGNAPKYRSIRGKNTIFTGGKIVSGNYKCTEWKDGDFCGDTLECRFWSGGVFNGKHLVCEQVTGGVFKSGVVECQSWHNAEFGGDVLDTHNWYDGTFNGNVFHGKWRGGTWNGKQFKGIDLVDGALNK